MSSQDPIVRGTDFVFDDVAEARAELAYFTDPDGNQLILNHRYAPRGG